MMNLPEPAIAVRDLRVSRGGVEVLHGLTFEMPRGQVTGLLGPSGCGKTTLMRAIVGVQIVTGGEVTVLGRPAGDPSLRRSVGYSTQSPAVYRDLSVVENLRYFAAVLKAPRSDVDRVIEEVGLSSVAGQLGGTLSGGQLNRASLAVALLGSPELVVLDEPTVGLDPVLRQELWLLFQSLADRGVTLIVSSHVMDEAARCQRLIVMREGEILADDTPHDLREHTRTTDLEEAFLRLIEERTAA
ncbi:ABC transporter ATP-binding protein [Planotetraspora phitsanulokensis]|uniref:Multidrug ABC transporter ATP-binding protein n=1 Tax=Planotetraspora phitsanulokensis TaxID=575192 RepID=A0A8J3XFB0_9ACTN|nr:ABC transporter ATP-binding protein [Planotetraspora phitsanulokensis]GII38031.1 multidrug ABC transporter ATP-binding protein [Planotetraspora phitsanulokensis]